MFKKKIFKKPISSYVPPASVKIKQINDKNIGIGTVIARECVGNNIEILVNNINHIAGDGEELSAISNFEFINGLYHCIVLVRQLPSDIFNIRGIIDYR